MKLIARIIRILKEVKNHENTRDRKIVWSAVAATTAKATTILTTLLTIPLTLEYLGDERYGMWMAITSLISLLSFADLGIGNGILTLTASASGKNDHLAISKYLSAGIFTLSGITIILLLGVVISYRLIPWESIFNAKSELAIREAAPTIAVLVSCVAINLPLSVTSRIWIGLQMGYVVHLWQCLGSFIGLIGVLTSIHYKVGLPGLVFSSMFGQIFSLAAVTIHFIKKNRNISLSIKQIDSRIVHQIAATGFLYLVLQLVASVAYTTDNLIIAHYLGAADVTNYSITEKLFSTVSMLLGMVLAPLWPAYGEAISRGDGEWVSRTLRRSIKIGAIGALIASSVVAVCAPQLLEHWLKAAIEPTPALLAGFVLWKTIETVGNALAAYLNGAHIVRAQIVIATLTAVAAVTLKIALISNYGPDVLPWVMAISFAIFALLPYAILIPRIAKERYRE